MTHWIADWEIKPVLSDSKKARVFSPVNIALAKYWGKRDVKLNLPTNGSISVSLENYGSFTTVEFHHSFLSDELILNGKPQPEKLSKVQKVLNEVRKASGISLFARVQSKNNFPTGAGLASSASGISAVAFAAARALHLDVSQSKVSEWARLGSGSACRSLFDGYVEWRRGELADGSDSIAHSLFTHEHWPLNALIVIVNSNEKGTASTNGMEHTRKTSPYFSAWVESSQKSLPQFRQAIAERDFLGLARLAESNCIQMHASAMAANPPVVYWQSQTMELIHKAGDLRNKGIPVFFTIDAGPNVVLFCEPDVTLKVKQELAEFSVLETKLGLGTKEI